MSRRLPTSSAVRGLAVDGPSLAADAGLADRASALAARLGLPLLGPVDAAARRAGAGGGLLVLGADGLSLHGAAGVVRVDLAGGALGARVRRGVGRREPVAKAVGLAAATPTRTVLDATAGLGRDAWLLAHLGAEVVAAERHPVVGALLADGLERAARDPALAEVAGRIRLETVDARELLVGRTPSEVPDAVSVDPMFPPRRKSSLVKKEMRVVAELVGAADDADLRGLVEAALAVARRRVVVKRPADAPPVDAPRPPDLAVPGGHTTRYDVWLTA